MVLRAMAAQAAEPARVSDDGYLRGNPTEGPEYNCTGKGDSEEKTVKRIKRHSWVEVDLKDGGGRVQTLRVGDAVMLTCAAVGEPVEIGQVTDIYKIMHKTANPNGDFSVDVQWFFRKEMMEDADIDKLQTPPHARELFLSEAKDAQWLADTFEGCSARLTIKAPT